MDDLRRLLRYEIPGIMTIIYSLMFSSPILFGVADSYSVELTKTLSESAIMIVVLALPIGFLVYNSYLRFGYKEFLENRKGYEIVGHILEKDSSLKKELSWWEKENDAAVKNEILDIVFYGEHKDLGGILERFVNFYHSSNVIGRYAPLVAFSASMVLIAVLALFSHISLHIFISNFRNIATLYLLAILLIVVIWFVIIPPTQKGGQLLKRIDELETNILLLEKENIKEIVKEKTSVMEKNPGNKHNFAGSKRKNTGLIELYKSHFSMTRTYLSLFYTLITFSITVGLGGTYKLYEIGKENDYLLFFSGLIILLLFLAGTTAVSHNILTTLEMLTKNTTEIEEELSIIEYSWKAKLLDNKASHKRITPIRMFLKLAFWAFLVLAILVLIMIVFKTYTDFDLAPLESHRDDISVVLLFMATVVISSFGYLVMKTSKI